LREKQAVMPYFELWQRVKVSEREKWEGRETDGKCVNGRKAVLQKVLEFH